jgi:hypothetical protein
MTRDTEAFIQHLAENVEPVRPFGRPWIRTGVWISVSILYVWVVLLMMVHWRGLPPITFDLRFIVEVFSGLAAGVAAAACAFASVIPGYNRKVLVGLVAPLAVWLGSLGDGCIQEWVRYGSQSLSLHHDLSCFPFIAFLGSLPAVALALMLRRGAPLTPHRTAALGGFAAAGLGNLGLRLIHPEGANIGLLVWHIGGVFVLAAAAAGAGHYLLNWRSITGVSRDSAQ